MAKTYRSSSLDVDFGHANEGFVEVLDRLGGIFGRLVTDISNTPRGEVLHIRYGEFGEMLPYIFVGKLGRQTAHKDARGFGRIHGCAV